jgi:4a-hydroxytetrahydrobiopterin dehydratase
LRASSAWLGAKLGAISVRLGAMTQATSKRRGYGKDSIYWDESRKRLVGAVSLGFSADGTRIRKKVSGRTKTEVRDKLRELHHLRVDMRPDRVELSVQTRALGVTTGCDSQLAHRIDAALAGLGHAPAGATSAGSPRTVQMLELAIDAMDILVIRPFWKAVLGYADEPGSDGGQDAIVDPAGQLPAIWFQQMDSPRPQRNRIHFDITVADDEAGPRVRAALAAGGRLVDDSFARSFWVLADAEGNEVCVCTWTDRDEREQ